MVVQINMEEVDQGDIMIVGKIDHVLFLLIMQNLKNQHHPNTADI